MKEDILEVYCFHKGRITIPIWGKSEGFAHSRRRIALTQAVLTLAFLLVFVHARSAAQPYETNRATDEPIIAGTAVLGIIGLSLYSTLPPLTAGDLESLNRHTVNSFDRSATYFWSDDHRVASDIGLALCVAAPLLLLGGDTSVPWETVVVMYAETMALAMLVPASVKGLVLRPRPFVYNPEAPLEKKLEADARRSFFSGHAAGAFAASFFLGTVFQNYFPGSTWKTVVWCGSLATATATAYLRYRSGMHYPTDVIVGAAAGSLIGIVIPLLHKSSSDDSGSPPVPSDRNVRIGISIPF